MVGNHFWVSCLARTDGRSPGDGSPLCSSEEEAGVHLQRLYPEQTLQFRLQPPAQEGLPSSL